MKFKRLNPVVPTMTVVRHADGAVCVITASEFDPAVYAEGVPSAGQPVVPRPSKQARDREVMRRVRGSTRA